MAEKEMKNGWSIAIFPEGGIPDYDNPKMVPFKTGAFKLAKSLNRPIVSITFVNNYFLFSDPSEILGPARPGISKVVIHDVISAEEVSKSSVEELCDKSFHLINDPLIKTYPSLHKNN